MRRQHLPLASAMHGLTVHATTALPSMVPARVHNHDLRWASTSVDVCGVQVLQDPADGRLRGQGLARTPAPARNTPVQRPMHLAPARTGQAQGWRWAHSCGLTRRPV